MAKKHLSWAEQSDLHQSLAAWRSRAHRRGRLLKLIRTFLATILAASNDSVKRTGIPRGEESQSLYVLAQHLVNSISEEIKNDRETNDYADARRWRPRRASSDEAHSAS